MTTGRISMITDIVVLHMYNMCICVYYIYNCIYIYIYVYVVKENQT